jgi:carbon storage regulator
MFLNLCNLFRAGENGRKGMLVLSRKLGEAIVIGDNVEVRVIGIFGGRVQLGIQAPKFISVDRSEVRDLKELERKEQK